MDMQSAIRAVTEHRDLDPDEMVAVMRAIMTGEATQAQIGGFLVGLRMKGETVAEIAAAASVMRELATHVNTASTPLVDTCGTGGDGASTFNISTVSAFAAAGAGAYVAKHGNRAVSSNSGSADVLEAAGVNLNLSPEQVGQCIDRAGVGFMFAQRHHNAMKHAIGPRREMAVRTIFNLLGPLTNPANAPCQVVGVFSAEWVEPLAKVFAHLGSRHVLVVHGEDGLDEISICAPTQVSELKDGAVSSYTVTPEQFGLTRADAGELAASSVADSLATLNRVLDDESGPARDIVTLNAGAAIYVSGLATSLADGIEQAAQSISAGRAKQALLSLVEISSEMGS